jgi:hypothetical protein
MSFTSSTSSPYGARGRPRKYTENHTVSTLAVCLLFIRALLIFLGDSPFVKRLFYQLPFETFPNDLLRSPPVPAWRRVEATATRNAGYSHYNAQAYGCRCVLRYRHRSRVIAWITRPKPPACATFSCRIVLARANKRRPKVSIPT